jgi:hypothetical protein
MRWKVAWDLSSSRCLGSVVAKWDGGERDLAARKLADALELAERLGYA